MSLFFVFLVVLDDTMRTEPVSIGSSCSEVAVLPCGSTMMQGTALETLNLNTIWRRNGQDFTPDSDSEVVSHSHPISFDIALIFSG